MTAAFQFLGIRGLIAVGFAIALGIVMWRADAIAEQRDALRDRLAQEEARHAVTRQSVATLEDVIADLNEQAEQRAEAFAEAQELAKERDKELARLAKSSNAKIERLRRIAERGSNGSCEVPADLARELEGL